MLNCVLLKMCDVTYFDMGENRGEGPCLENCDPGKENFMSNPLRRSNNGFDSLDLIEYEKGLEIHPRLPAIPGIFNIPPDTCICSHPPHSPIPEHLHAHFYHMHIRYGFEFPFQPSLSVDNVALQVMMAINGAHRVDCNPMFVARGKGAEGVCLKVGGEDIHWVHDDEAGPKAKELFEATGRRLPEGFYFSGFQTSDPAERKVRRFGREELKRMIGQGLRVDQHFQATWKEPREAPIEPYDVVICLTDDKTSYLTFFNLPVVVPIGAF